MKGNWTREKNSLQEGMIPVSWIENLKCMQLIDSENPTSIQGQSYFQWTFKMQYKGKMREYDLQQDQKRHRSGQAQNPQEWKQDYYKKIECLVKEGCCLHSMENNESQMSDLNKEWSAILVQNWKWNVLQWCQRVT